MTESNLPSLIAHANSLGYRIGNAAQSSRGWELTLWSGQVGYSDYICTHDLSLSRAIELAIDAFANGLGKSLDANLRKVTTFELNSILANLRPKVVVDRRF
jgi:hypothetical protein